jgi:MFS family permease
MILTGYLLCVVATVAFGLLSHLPRDKYDKTKPLEGKCPGGVPKEGEDFSHSKVFFGLSLATRFIQGVGDSMVATSSYSIVSIEFPAQREIYIGYCQTAVGLGLLLGPVIGTGIYAFAAYEGTFYALAGVLLCSFVTALLLLPNRINKYANDKPSEQILE